MTPISTLKKTESFQIIEDRPPCHSPLDARIQEVIRPAMLVVSADGQRFLLYMEEIPNSQHASRDETPSGGQPQLKYPK